MNKDPSPPELRTGAMQRLLHPSDRALSLVGFAILAATLLALRIGLWPLDANADMQGSFIPWQTYLIKHGRWRALRQPFSPYFPAYFELTTLTSYLDGWLFRVSQIKLVSLCFDLTAAALAYLIVGVLRRQSATPFTSRRPQLLAVLAILAGPTVILNGAVWGQTDIVYTSFLLASVLAILCRHGGLSILLFGFALAFKLQAIFLLPFFVAMLLARRLRIVHFAFLPVGWLLSVVPVLLEGGDARAFLMLPFVQTGEFRSLAINVANPWEIGLLLRMHYRLGMALGLAISSLCGVLLIYWGVRKCARTSAGILYLAAANLLVMPYVLPKMHDRYFFPAEVFLSIAACFETSLILPTALILASSLISYSNYFLSDMRRTMVYSAFAAAYAALVLTITRIDAVVSSPRLKDPNA